MGYIVRMPKLGLEMERGTLLEWYVGEGDTVEEGEAIAEIESEKSIGEVDAREDGVLRLIALEEGEAVPPGTPIGIVAGADEDVSDLEAEFETDEGTEPTDDEGEAEAEAADPGAAPSGQTSGGGSVAETAPEDLKVSPRAEQRAEELGVVLAGIEGSGPQGAITEIDVESAAESRTGAGAGAEAGAGTEAATEVKASPRAKRRAEELGVDLSGIEGTGPQGAISEDDVEAAAETAPAPDDSPPEAAAPATAGIEAGRTAAAEGRYRTATLVVSGGAAETPIETAEMASNAFDVDASVLDVLLVAVSATLADHPGFNGTFENGTHHLHERRDVVLAAEADEGPVERVLEGVEARSFADLVVARRGGVERTDDADGAGDRGTFSLALADGPEADPATFVTPPTVAGLIATPSRRRAVSAENGNGVELQRSLSLTLSYDPRAIGDRDVEAFFGTLLEKIDRAPELVLRTYRGAPATDET
jgi:pyruvate dehydrogenase E2 component (dihydrolipoamide acetyltransferase)